mmetsp:Transcript_33477/g.67565  ORF Transcript_33477/g.67565 Transcript_33477/m.67565 type:complete len:89 (-) Transcript_33477:79-345(-)
MVLYISLVFLGRSEDKSSVSRNSTILLYTVFLSYRKIIAIFEARCWNCHNVQEIVGLRCTGNVVARLEDASNFAARASSENNKDDANA